MAECVRLDVRYNMPDENGETRRQRNARFGHPSPQNPIPFEGEHLWEWFQQLSRRRRSGPEAITFAEIGEWQRLTQTPIRPEEVQVLMHMDDAFVGAVRKEQDDEAVRVREKRKTK